MILITAATPDSKMEPPKQETVTIWLNNKSWFSFMKIRSFS
ncbi:hypothetical protein bthur0005_47890 [Bacillus thuringiensis serovar pakistani str. T13001]|nr:hypothetical protein bthur0005_47890 [Bacillus thuringiensis serovar pakistani str. T13001]